MGTGKTYETTAPLTGTGAVSDIYIGTMTESPPTPRPAVHLPMTIPTQSPDPTAICATTPMMKTEQNIGTQGFRPKRFAIGAAIKHPMRVPIDS